MLICFWPSIDKIKLFTKVCLVVLLYDRRRVMKRVAEMDQLTYQTAVKKGKSALYKTLVV